MLKTKLIKKISLLTFLLFILSTFWYPLHEIKASNIKTLVITFNSAPTNPTVTKAPLKYNKDFAWSYSFDDGIARGYNTAFKYMNGGYSDYIGQYFGGLYFTDGASPANNVPFRGGYAFYARNASYSDIHINTPSYIKWTELQDAVDNGWNVFNHGYTSASLGVNDPNDSYYTGDPGGHAVGALDYAYELSQENVEVASHISLKNNAGTVTGPLNMSHVILPNGDDNYIQPAFDGGAKGVYAQSPVFPFTDGHATIYAPDFTNVTNPIPTTGGRHVMPRWFDYDTRYLTGGANPGGLFTHIDDLASQSTGATKLWAQQFTHQITTSTYAPDANGGITWSAWKSLMDHVENTYGRFGNDKAWVAGAEEVYNYMMVKQNSVLSQNLVGNQLTVTIDITNVPANLTNNALSLIISSSNNATINSIDYGSDFTYHTDNKNTGLINLDWGVNSYSKNDITRVETLVSTAETSKRKSDIDVARAYVNLLTTNPNSIKTAYVSRLDAIVVPLRTWYVNVNGVDSLCNNATTTKSYPSPNHPSYNWNYFTVGNTSAVSCGDLLNLRDSDNQISTLSISNTAPFKNGSLQSVTTGNNSAIYPDTVIMDKAQIYSSTTTPAKIKLYGLDAVKTYNIKLFGYTSATGATGNSAITQYTIGVTTKELIVKQNLTNTVEFLNTLPVSGEIEITINPKVAAWGYGMLNAIEIKENILDAPSSLSYTSPNVYTKNSAIAQLNPTVTGQAITYSVSPALPTGLSLDTSTGAITGTPTVVSSLATYTVTATNTGGSTTFGIIITVNDIAPSSLSYSTPKVYTRGAAITPLSPTIIGENITYSVSPSLPAGLSINESTGVISGTPSGVASLNIYTVTASNSGGSVTFDFTMTVNDIPISSPIVLPSAGIYNGAQNVTLSSTGSDYIKYSTSSLPATCGDGTLYSSAISVSSSQTIYARACNVVGNSSTASFSYTIDTTPPEAPIPSVVAGSYNTTQSITLSAVGSTYIKYATDSLPSSCSTGTSYTGAISVSSSQTIYARACDDAGNSSTASFAYVIDTDAPLTPVASVSSGIYNTTKSITLSAVGSIYIKYATDSTPSSCSSGTSYIGEISVSSSQTIYARACDDAGNSSTASFSYTIDTTPPEAPIPSVVAGSYNTTQSITLSAVGSTYIKYATDSLPSSCSTGTSYTGAISVSSSQTIYARACDDAGNSSTASFAYVIDTSGNNNSETYMKYSTTATPVDCSSGSLYSSNLTFSSTTKLYMRVCKVSDNSSVSTFEYITPSGTTSNGGGSSGGGSSTGGSRYYPPASSSIVKTINSTMTDIIQQDKAIVISPVQKIKKDLEIGMKNKDVKTLQLFLIKQNTGFYANKLSLNGATTYFGKLTKQALTEWQKANNVYPAAGYFGSKTRSKIRLLNL